MRISFLGRRKIFSSIILLFICITVICIFLNLFERQFVNDKISVTKQQLDTTSAKKILEANLPWYFQKGTIFPDSEDADQFIWPDQSSEDRIINQLLLTKSLNTTKTIYAKSSEFHVPLGQSYFIDNNCPVQNCSFVESSEIADAVIFKDYVLTERTQEHINQIWIFYILESPEVSGFMQTVVKSSINWTATYRSDSEIVAPYEKWVYYDDNIQQMEQSRNYAEGKTKMVAWFVSNCQTKNNRLDYAKELQKYIDIDIYGSCGNYTCTRGENECYEMLKKDYKFYLAFENANCREYITEKFFVNALGNDVVPIVMGAHQVDYQRVAPSHSFIHVDDFPSAKALADYLSLLNSDDQLYNSYFKWKGTGEFINTRFFCRLCALLHSPRSPHFYPDFRDWWKPKDICRTGGWYS